MISGLDTMTITDLIPQRPPFVMVDRLTMCDITDAVTELTVRRDNLFVEANRLSQPGMVENMAQSCAARMGWLSMMRNESIKIGFIGEIRNCVLHRQPVVGELLTTRVHVVEDVFNITLATTTMSVGDEVLATATMKIALVDAVADKQ